MGIYLRSRPNRSRRGRLREYILQRRRRRVFSDPPNRGWFPPEGGIDLRDRNGRAPDWTNYVGSAVTGVRDFFYKADSINTPLRGTPPIDTGPDPQPSTSTSIQSTTMPRRSFKGMIKRYNTRRLATLRTRGYGGKPTYSARPTYRPRYKKRTTFRRKKSPGFSTKGIRLVDVQKYTLDASDTVRHPGYKAGSSFRSGFLRENKTQGDAGYWYLNELIGANYHWQHAFAQVAFNANTFIGYTTGMMQNFNKYKVNRVTMTFRFPDQAASTSNSQFPTALWVNYGAQKDVKFGNVSPNANLSSSVSEIITLPGWKKYDLKRMNKVTVSFAPRVMNNLESFTTSGTQQDVNTTAKNTWLPTTSLGTSTSLLGPAICFEFPNSYNSGATSSQPGNTNMWSSSVAGTFLQYTTVDVAASISFKQPNMEAYD